MLASGTTIISHGSDGKKTFSYSFTVSFDGIYFSGSNIGVKSGSGSGTLTTIPRTSNFTIPSSSAAGANIPISITRAVSSFTHDVKLQFGSKTQTYTGIATSVNVVAPLAWMDQIPGDPSGTLTVTVTTKSGSTVIGSTSKTMTITVPNDASTKPSVSMMLTPVSSLPSAFAGLYIQGKSKVKAAITASGKYGASIKSMEMSVGSVSYGSATAYTSGYLAQYGTVAIVGKAVDSRDYFNTVIQNIAVIAYSRPQIQTSICARCDSSGNLSDSGTYLRIHAKRIYSPVKSGNVQKNFCQIRYRYKSNADASYSGWQTLLAASVLSSDEVDSGALLAGALLVDKSYTVQVQAIDDIGEESTTTVSIPTDSVFMHKKAGGKALGIGKYAEKDDLLDVAYPSLFRGHSVFNDGYSLGETSFMVNGSDINTYYPVHIQIDSDTNTQTFFIGIGKKLMTATPAWSGNHSYGSSSLMIGFEFRARGWDGNGVIGKTLYKQQPYATIVAHAELQTGAARGIVVWLRGGGAEYNLSSNGPILSITPYYSTTNIGSSSSAVNVSPRTYDESGNNFGILDQTGLPAVIQANNDGNYWGFSQPITGSTIGWLRTTQAGLIPYANGLSSLGSSSWKFNNVYANNHYGAWAGSAIPIANGGTGTTNITQAKRNFGIYQGTYVFTRNGTYTQEISIASLTGSALTSMGAGVSVAITNGDWGANHEGLLAVSRKSSTVLRFFFETASSAAYRINVAVFNY